MSQSLSARTRLIALLGDPVSHSLSPRFQNAAFAAAGCDGVYVALRADADHVPGLIRGIARAGGGGNVTVPHKEVAAQTVERATEAVRRTGACNTWWLENEMICGDNTDVVGVTSAVRSVLGRAPEGARVLVLGAGGSARAALAAMADAGAEEIVVANRTLARAEALAGRFGPEGLRVRATTPGELPGERFDLAINTTSLGLHPRDALPLPLDGGVHVGAALDLVYSPSSTPWVAALRERGIPAADGIEMLILQGAASFERWWSRPAPLEVMREALSAVPA